MKNNRHDITRLKATIIAVTVMLLLLPCREGMAVSRDSAWWTHLVYMFAHGNIIHLAVNAWALLLMHRILMTYRGMAAWAASVIVSFIYYPALPVLGASTVIMFLIGYMLPDIKAARGWSAIAYIGLCTSVGFLIPQLAGMYHLLCMTAGIIFFFMDRTAQSVWSYCVKD